jgi:hypothetical protein
MLQKDKKGIIIKEKEPGKLPGSLFCLPCGNAVMG